MGLTFELSGDQKQAARKRQYHRGVARPAFGTPLERLVRRPPKRDGAVFLTLEETAHLLNALFLNLLVSLRKVG